MGKSRIEQINTIESQIEQLKERKKELLMTAQKHERKDRNRRLIILGSRVEAVLKLFGIDLKNTGNTVPEEVQQAVYRYIQIGKTLENVLGQKLTDKSVSRFEEFIKSQEERGNYASNAILKN